MRPAIIIVLVFCCQFAIGQLHDQNWMLGYLPNQPLEGYGGSHVSFENDSFRVQFFNTTVNLFGNTTISDSSGGLIGYSNGCSVLNAAHEIMVDGGGINPGDVHNAFCEVLGYPTAQGMITLPYPGQPGLYVIFHMRFQDDYYTYDLMYSVVDTRPPNEAGRVIVKNQLIGSALFNESLTAVKHANGRDWWIVLPETMSDRFWVWRLDVSGVIGPSLMNWGIDWNDKNFYGWAAFSSDGRYYACGNKGTGIKLALFDRCTGEFASEGLFDLSDLDQDSLNHCCLVFSPNNRFLYLSTGYYLYQYDLQSANPFESRVLIGVWDGHYSPFPSSFFHPVLAPDGKIYMGCVSGSDVLHVIQYPDQPGIACRFEQHAISLPTYMARLLPHFPAYRLGPIDGSACDTLGMDNIPMARWRYELWSDSAHFVNLSDYLPDTWHWDFGDPESGGNNYSNLSNPTHVFSAPGAYEVCLRVANAYGADTLCKTVWIPASSLYEIRAGAPHIYLTPNPAREQITVRLPSTATTWALSDVTGTVIYSGLVKNGAPDLHLSMAGLIRGLYFFTVSTQDGSRYVKKVMKI